MLFGQLNKLPIFVLLHTLAVVHAIPLLDKEPLSLSLPPQRLDRRAAPINFKSCSSGEITLINGHLDDMQEMARAAASHAYAGNKYFDGFFGKQPGGHAVPNNHIHDRYQLISKAKSEPWHASQAPTIRCDFENSPKESCRGFGAPAMTGNPGGEHPTIWICASYWKAPLRLRQVATPVKGTMKPLDEFVPNGGLLLHEFTHAWFATADVKLREGAKKGKVAYNHEYVLRLLREANGPTKTRNNAHTYAIFAAAVTFNKSSWSLNPDHLSADRDLK